MAKKAKLEFLKIKHYNSFTYYKTYMFSENNYQKFFMIFQEFFLHYLIQGIKNRLGALTKFELFDTIFWWNMVPFLMLNSTMIL